MALTKVSGDILDTGIVVAGVTTSTNFKTGTSNLHSSGIEIAGINVLGADTPIGAGVTIYNSGGADFTGVVTATRFVGQADISGGSITATTGTFSGDVSIGGTLTYQDVTNIDSVGLITARNGLKVLADGANIVGVVTASAGIIDSTLTAGRVVYVDSDKSLTDSANLTFNGSDLLIDATTNAYKGVKFDNSFNLTFGSSSGSSPRLYLQGTSNGQSDAGDTFFATGTGGVQKFRSNTYTKFEVNADNTAAEALRINSSGQLIAGATVSGTEGGSNTKLCIIGTGSAGVTPSSIASSTLATFRMTGGLSHAAGISILAGSDGSSVINLGDRDNELIGRILYNHTSGNSTDYMSFYVQGSEKIQITSGGHITPANAGTQNLGSTSKEFNNLYLGDGGSAYFGNDQDFQIYHHSGGNSYIKETGGGALVINADDFYLQNVATTTYLRTHSSGQIDLTHSGNTKLSTSSTGVTVTGEVAATQDYPVIKPTLDLNFAATKSLDPRIKYYRHGPASYVDQTGRLVLVGENIPRFDHDIATGECKGLLIEEARTNLVTNSTLKTDGAEGNITKTRAEGPDGVSDSALQVTFTASGGAFLRSGAVSCSASTEYTFSIWIKKVSGSVNGTGAFYSYLTGSSSHGLFNTSGFVNTEGETLSAQPTGVWRRFTQTKTTPSGTSAIDFVLPGYDSNGLVLQYYGLQLEAGGHATSFIPTYGFTQTRGADNAFMDAIGDSFYNQNEGTAIIEYNYTEENDGAHSLFSFAGKESDPDSSNPRQWLRINKTAGTARGIRYSLTTDAGSSNDDSSAVATPGQWDKFAFAYTAGDQDLYLNGSSINDLSRTPPTNCYRLSFGNIGWSLGLETIMLEGHIRRFMYYPNKLPNSQLGTITS